MKTYLDNFKIVFILEIPFSKKNPKKFPIFCVIYMWAKKSVKVDMSEITGYIKEILFLQRYNFLQFTNNEE